MIMIKNSPLPPPRIPIKWIYRKYSSFDADNIRLFPTQEISVRSVVLVHALLTDVHKFTATTMTAKDLKSKNADAEGQVERLPYPKSIFFIVSNEFCERFSYYGMRTILSIYLTDILLFQENTSKIIFHIFAFLVYFFPTLGAIIADSWLGKFKTIFYLSIVYAIGSILLALAATPPLNLPQVAFSMLGLFIIALGTGGIKPCVSAFGGDQFVLPQQELQLATFFSMFYFSINAGSLLSTALTPILREDIHCFDQTSCYSLAFAVPGVLMVISVVVFVLGRPLYRIIKPQGNMVVTVSKCMSHALKTKRKSSEKKEHWLDYAEKEYGKELIGDIKTTLRVLFLYIPLPVFWALFDQQATGWTFQARKMDGDIGFYTILPDQMQVINPLLILIFIPLFQYVIYPVMTKFNLLKTPLKRMGTGGLLVGLSFFISASISLALEGQNPELPEPGFGQLRIYNNRDCDLKLTSAKFEQIIIAPMGYYENTEIQINEGKDLNIQFDYTCNLENGATNIKVQDQGVIGYFFENGEKELINFEDDVRKDEKASPKIRVLSYNKENVLTFKHADSGITTKSNYTNVFTVSIGSYDIYLGDKKLGNHEFKLGGVYSVFINENAKLKVVEITAPNDIHMLWMIPQYIIITMGEIMFSITGLEFSYSQAPSSMKSVLQASWLLTTAVGNLLVVIIEAIDPFEEQSSNFFLYAGLMMIDMVIFAFMAMKYKYIEKKDEGEDKSKSDN